MYFFFFNFGKEPSTDNMRNCFERSATINQKDTLQETLPDRAQFIL